MPFQSLEDRVGDALAKRNQTIATAESCSGGLISHRLTNVAGSSAYFMGAVVTYSNQAKMRVLSVGEATLLEEGAVSARVAGEMAQGVRTLFGVDWGIGVTGIAGPGGGSAEKPVGLVYICVCGPSGSHVTRSIFSGSRLRVKEQTAETALELLLERTT